MQGVSNDFSSTIFVSLQCNTVYRLHFAYTTNYRVIFYRLAIQSVESTVTRHKPLLKLPLFANNCCKNFAPFGNNRLISSICTFAVHWIDQPVS